MQGGAPLSLAAAELSEAAGNRPRVSVVIPNWNGLKQLPECLQTLFAQSFQDFEVVLVDNASADSSVAWVRRHHPQVRIIERSDNGGFAKAVNAGIVASHSEFVVLLNNDTAVDPDWLASLVIALDDHPAYDFAAPMMLLYSDPELLNAAGDIYVVRRLFGANRGFGRVWSMYAEPQRVLGASAGAAIYRRSLFDDVGLFDEDFFLMHEDTDLNLRCLLAGKRCLYVPGARMRHKVGVTRDMMPTLEMTEEHWRNGAMVAAKDLPLSLLAAGLLVKPWQYFRATFALRPSYWPSLPARVHQVPARLRAEAYGFRKGWAKRPEIWSRRSARRREIIRWLVRGWGPV